MKKMRKLSTQVISMINQKYLLSIMCGVCGTIVYSTMTGTLPLLVGCSAMGALIFGSLYGNLQTFTTNTETITVTETVPYDEWPDDCYGCNNTIGTVRGQFVVQRGENSKKIKAVGLCEECTRTYSTLIEYSDVVQESFDDRGDTE